MLEEVELVVVEVDGGLLRKDDKPEEKSFCIPTSSNHLAACITSSTNFPTVTGAVEVVVVGLVAVAVAGAVSS